MKLFHKQNNKDSMGDMLSPKKLFNQLYHLGKEKKEKAIVFVDYEHWFYSCRRLYRLKPDIIEWEIQLEKKYLLEDIIVFADFSEEHKGIREELPKVRYVTQSIVETQQMKMDFKRNMTDFMMLNYIYQYVIEHPKIDTYILFTGYVQFESVVRYLKLNCNKNVIVYGVRDAFSSELKQVASEWIELPELENILKEIYPIIIKQMAYAESRFDFVPTFEAIVKAISRKNNIPRYFIIAALNEMLEKGLLYTRKYRVGFKQYEDALSADWEALVKEGLWVPD